MNRRKTAGIIFIAVALLRLAHLWGIVSMDWLWQRPWTEYLVVAAVLYIGLELLISSYKSHRDQWLERPIPFGDNGKRLVCATRFGGDKYVFRGEPFHGARLDTFCGGIRFDLRQAAITEDEAIDIRTCLGGVELIVPPTVNVVVSSHSFIGGVGNETGNILRDGAPTLHVTASNMLGGVSIRNKE